MERAQLAEPRHQPVRGEQRRHARACSRISSALPWARSIASPSSSSAGPISASSRSPSGLSWTAWWRRSNRGRPTWRSSAWMRRVRAGEDKASASAAALTEPSRAACDERLDGGQRRQPLHRNGLGLTSFVRCTSSRSCIDSAEYRSFMRAYSALVAFFFALAQKLCKREKDPAFQASSPKNFQGSVFGPAPFFSARAFDRPLAHAYVGRCSEES